MSNPLAVMIDNILRMLGCKTINRQFLLSYGIIFLLAAASGLSLYFSMAINPQTINVAGRQRMLSQRMAKEAMLVAAEIEQRASLQRTIDLFEKSHRAIIDGDAAQGMNPLDDEATLQQMVKVERLWKQYKALIEQHVTENNAQTLSELKSQSSVVLEEMNKAVVMMTQAADKTTRTQLMIAFVCVMAILVLVVLGRVFGVSMLMNNIERLQRRMAEVGKGDFSHRFSVVHSDNEVGAMYTAYNQMLTHVSELLRNVRAVAANTEHHVESVMKATADAERGVSRQYNDLELVATAMNEMAATVQEVARNTSDAEAASAEVNQQAHSGGEVVHQSEAQAQQMQQNLQDTAAIIRALEEETIAVGNVTSVISGIAEQTNLLALNAAIEAARAGDKGRGFAVVADEVRTLAQRTQESTQEIKGIISRLQIKAEEAVGSMTQSTDLAVRSTELAQSAARALEEVVASVETISSMNTMISTAAEEQGSVAMDIDQRILSISEVAGNTKQDTEEVVRSTEEIRREIRQLNKLIQNFKLAD